MALHALFIAVPEYQHALISRLPGTRNDAEALHQQFHYGLKCGDKARLLVAPTVAEVREAFAAVGEALRQGDTFVLYFSGHGVERPGTDEQYLLLHGAEMDAIHDGEWENLKDALSDSYLRKSLMRRWPPVHRVFVYDACRTHLEHHMGVGEMLPFASEAALDRLAGKAPQYGRKLRQQQIDDQTAAPREQDGTTLSTVYLKSCRSGQKAYEIQGAERGVFGLSLHAELEDSVLNQRDVVLAREFVQRLQRRMDGLLREHGLGDTQQVWMSDCPVPVPLWLPNTLPSPPPTPPAGLDPYKLSTLLVNWTTQLQEGRYTEPAWDSCAGSLGVLRHEGLPQEALQALQTVALAYQAKVDDASRQLQARTQVHQQLEDVRNELASTKASHVEAQSHLAEMSERVSRLAIVQKQLAAVQHELASTKASHVEAQSRLATMSERVSTLTNDLEQYRIGASVSVVEYLSWQVSTLAEEKEQLESALLSFKKRSVARRSAFAHKRAALEETEAEIDALRAALAVSRERVQATSKLADESHRVDQTEIKRLGFELKRVRGQLEHQEHSKQMQLDILQQELEAAREAANLSIKQSAAREAQHKAALSDVQARLEAQEQVTQQQLDVLRSKLQVSIKQSAEREAQHRADMVRALARLKEHEQVTQQLDALQRELEATREAAELSAKQAVDSEAKHEQAMAEVLGQFEEARERSADSKALKVLRRVLGVAKRPQAATPVLAPESTGANLAYAQPRERRRGNGAALKPGHRWREADWSPELVWCPAGSFLMGSPDHEPERRPSEGPQCQVNFAEGFWIGRCAISFAEFDRFAEATKRPLPNDTGWGRGKQPAISMNWHDAQEYAAWLNKTLGLPEGTYHLPSESQWEYACRSGTTTPFWHGARIHPGQANYDGTKSYNGSPVGEYRQRTVAVDALEPNLWGLHNVHGNTWEWVEDAWNDDLAKVPRDGRTWVNAASSLRVLRGGSWVGDPRDVRSATRYGVALDYRSGGTGFRIARTL